MNKVCLVGRIANNLELRYTASGIPYTRFGVAINRQFSNSAGEKETDFINIVVWRKQAENICNYLDKGSLVSVEGRIQTGSYNDKDGNRRYSFDIVADNVQFLETRAQAELRRNSTNTTPYSFQNDFPTNEPPSYDLNNNDDVYKVMGDAITLEDENAID